MSSAPLVALLSLAALFGRHPRADQGVRVHTYGVQGWKLEVGRDGFSGDVRCRVSKRVGRAVASYAAGRLYLRFDPGQETLDTVYRLDGGPARRWRPRAGDLAPLRMTSRGEGLESTTGGVVALPMSEMAGARAAAIRPSLRASIVTVPLDSLRAALASARAAGCVSDAAFEP